jgi:hypothetical protein
MSPPRRAALKVGQPAAVLNERCVVGGAGACLALRKHLDAAPVGGELRDSLVGLREGALDAAFEGEHRLLGPGFLNPDLRREPCTIEQGHEQARAQ